jgi:hypothetical protein
LRISGKSTTIQLNMRAHKNSFWILILLLSFPFLLAFGTKTSAGGASSSSSEMVWVSRSDGSQMCASDSGKTLEQGADELRRSQIHVLSSQKGSDRKMHAQMCGLPTGKQNAYQIPKDDLGKANILGYQEVK